MAVTSSVLPSPEAKSAFVRAMFDRIAPRYDLLNRLLTLGMDQRWRAQLVRSLELDPGDPVLDLATGTGDLIAHLQARGARPIGLDLAGVMLRHARLRAPLAPLVQGNGEALPLPDASVRAVTCGFAVRNFTQLEDVLRECARVLRPEGQLALLEVDQPRHAWLRKGHDLYFRRVVPRIGGLLSDREAYRYLPESTAFLPPEPELRAMLTRAGFERIDKRTRLLGAIQWIQARRVP